MYNNKREVRLQMLCQVERETDFTTRRSQIEEIERQVKNLNIFKQTAFDEGRQNRIIIPSLIPERFAKGYIAEIATASILGRVYDPYKSQLSIDLKPSFDFEYDLKKKCDMLINGVEVNIKSQKTVQKRSEYISDCDAIVYYDKPGLFNLLTVLETVGINKFISDSIAVADINYLWELYISTLIREDMTIIYKGYTGEKLNNLKLYEQDFPNFTLLSN